MMTFEIDYDKYFPNIINNSRSSKETIYKLLDSIGKSNGGILAPYTKKVSEEHFVNAVKSALDRQVLFYVNYISGNDDFSFLGKEYIDQLVSENYSIEQYKFVDVINESKNFVSLKENPYFTEYDKLFLSQGSSLSSLSINVDPYENELLSIKLRLSQKKVNLFNSSVQTIFRHEKISSLRNTSINIENVVSSKNNYSTILFDYNYFQLLISQISEAKISIDIIMFYFALDRRKKNAITTKLFNSIVDAKERGVEVNVLLDRDKEGQKYYTRKINRNAIESLKAAGINARFDSTENVIHSKIVVIDSNIVFLGSHNFSISSSFRYEEVSVMIQNQVLGAKYKDFISATK